MTRVDDIVVVVQDARRLVHPWTDLAIGGGKVVKTKHNSLVAALRAKSKELAIEEGGNAAGKPVVTKIPVPQESALSIAIEIEQHLAWWALYFGASAKGKTPAANYDFICRRIDEYDDDVVAQVSKHLGDLLASAEEELEIRPRPKVLRAKCPGCEVFGHIRIGIDKDGRATDAVCKNCEARWSRYQLGQLASAIEEREEA